MRFRALTLAMLLLPISCVQRRTDNVVELAAGFRGWVTVEFERSDCPPLQKRTGAWVLPIPADGYLCTSNPLEEGWATDAFVERGKESTPLAQAKPSDPAEAVAEIRVRGFVVGNSTAVQAGEPTRHWWHFCVGAKDSCPHEEVVLPRLPKNAAG